MSAHPLPPSRPNVYVTAKSLTRSGMSWSTRYSDVNSLASPGLNAAGKNSGRPFVLGPVIARGGKAMDRAGIVGVDRSPVREGNVLGGRHSRTGGNERHRGDESQERHDLADHFSNPSITAWAAVPSQSRGPSATATM